MKYTLSQTVEKNITLFLSDRVTIVRDRVPAKEMQYIRWQ